MYILFKFFKLKKSNELIIIEMYEILSKSNIN